LSACACPPVWLENQALYVSATTVCGNNRPHAGVKALAAAFTCIKASKREIAPKAIAVFDVLLEEVKTWQRFFFHVFFNC
jgi:hypothetical protein